MSKHIGIIFGPNSVGKGTLANKLSENFGYYHLNTGDLVRHWINREHSDEVTQQYKSGKLMTDELIEEILMEKLNYFEMEGIHPGIILDGLPRRKSQIDMIKRICEKYDYYVKWVMCLEAPLEYLIDRAEGRVTAPDGNIYHLKYNPPPKWIDKDDLIKREDDNTEVVKERYNIFVQETSECLRDEYLSEVKRLDIDATKSIEEVYKTAERFLSNVLEQ